MRPGKRVQFPADQAIALPQCPDAGSKARAVIPSPGGEILVEMRGSDAGGEQSVALQGQHLGAVRLGDPSDSPIKLGGIAGCSAMPP
jgi:hypothetical protein